MGTPAKPLTLQLIERTAEILKAVTLGSSYNYTIGENVAIGLRSYQEAPGYPWDCVYLGSDHRPPEYIPDHQVFRYPTIVVAGFVDEENGEPISKLTKHLADVQLAIETDLRSGEAGSLSQLCGWGRLGTVITDEGELGLEGAAGFRLDINFCLPGDWGEL